MMSNWPELASLVQKNDTGYFACCCSFLCEHVLCSKWSMVLEMRSHLCLFTVFGQVR